jgi:hypothetical protein
VPKAIASRRSANLPLGCVEDCLLGGRWAWSSALPEQAAVNRVKPTKSAQDTRQRSAYPRLILAPSPTKAWAAFCRITAMQTAASGR